MSEVKTMDDKLVYCEEFRNQCDTKAIKVSITHALFDDTWGVLCRGKDASTHLVGTDLTFDQLVNQTTKFIDRILQQEPWEDISQEEKERLNDRHRDFRRNLDSQGRVGDHILLDDHTTRIVPKFINDIDLFIDILKYYSYVEELRGWMVKIGQTCFRFNTDSKWDEFERMVSEQIIHLMQEFPYEILRLYKVPSTDSYLAEIRRFTKLPKDQYDKAQVYHWLRIDGVRVEGLKFISFTNATGDTCEIRTFESCVVQSDKQHAFVIDDMTIRYESHKIPVMMQSNPIRACIARFLKTLPEPVPNA